MLLLRIDAIAGVRQMLRRGCAFAVPDLVAGGPPGTGPPRPAAREPRASAGARRESVNIFVLPTGTLFSASLLNFQFVFLVFLHFLLCTAHPVSSPLNSDDRSSQVGLPGPLDSSSVDCGSEGR